MAEPPPNGGGGESGPPQVINSDNTSAAGCAAEANQGEGAVPVTSGGCGGGNEAAVPVDNMISRLFPRTFREPPVCIASPEALQEWAKVDGTSPTSGDDLSEELDGIIFEVARTGAVEAYSWEALRLLLAHKIEHVLRDFWNNSQDLEVTEGESFERFAVEPLTRALLDKRRSGLPFTTQRLCELLATPWKTYSSTRKFVYALQRMIVITATEEQLLKESLDQDEMNGSATAPSAGRKRKLPPEMANGVV